MKTRIIVAAIGIPIIFLIIFFAPLWVFALFVGLISACCAFELLRCLQPDEPKRFIYYAAGSGFVIPLVCALVWNSWAANSVLYLLSLIMFVELMISFKREEQIKIETVFQVVFAGGVMPLFLSALVRVGSDFYRPIYLLLPFIAAFSCDSGAYFAGKFLGKRKAFPHLSPNKTVEGCIGGLAASVLMMLIYGAILTACKMNVNFFSLIVYGIGGGAACQVGDLAFSAIKRQRGIKDYGNLIPGHGGALDRFDSMHFTAPVIELLVLLVPMIEVELW